VTLFARNAPACSWRLPDAAKRNLGPSQVTEAHFFKDNETMSLNQLQTVVKELEDTWESGYGVMVQLMNVAVQEKCPKLSIDTVDTTEDLRFDDLLSLYYAVLQKIWANRDWRRLLKMNRPSSYKPWVIGMGNGSPDIQIMGENHLLDVLDLLKKRSDRKKWLKIGAATRRLAREQRQRFKNIRKKLDSELSGGRSRSSKQGEEPTDDEIAAIHNVIRLVGIDATTKEVRSEMEKRSIQMNNVKLYAIYHILIDRGQYTGFTPRKRPDA